jgi:hypothetical protein
MQRRGYRLSERILLDVPLNEVSSFVSSNYGFAYSYIRLSDGQVKDYPARTAPFCQDWVFPRTPLPSQIPHRLGRAHRLAAWPPYAQFLAP